MIGNRKHVDLKQHIIVNTGTAIIKPSESVKLLGLTIHESAKWKEHLISGENSLVRCLTQRLYALKKVSVNASFKTRLMTANACFMSVLSYMITVWGGTEKYLVKAIQVVQNNAARCITKQSWFTSTRILLKQCNWMSIMQLIFYQTAVQTWKLKSHEVPPTLFTRLQLIHTRSRAEGNLRIPDFTTLAASKSFHVRAAMNWNHIPAEIRNLKHLGSFKTKLREWVKVNIPIE